MSMLHSKKQRFLRWGILISALVFIFIGIAQEEHLVVLNKAINICLECIGIG